MDSDKANLERMIVELTESTQWLRTVSDESMRSTIFTEEWPATISGFYERQFGIEATADTLLNLVKHKIVRDQPAKSGEYSAASFSEIAIESHRSAMFALGMRLAHLDARLKSCSASDVESWREIWDSAAEGIAHILGDVDLSAVKAEAQCEVRNIPDDAFPRWSKPRPVSDWLRVLKALGQPMTDKDFQRRRNAGEFRQHPESGRQSVRIDVATLPEGYTDSM